MSKAQHTPGPWYEAGGTVYYDLGDRAYPIAVTIARRRLLEANANARLIAAAPELLEALKEIVDFWDANVPTNLVNEMHTKARAAIAKAKE